MLRKAGACSEQRAIFTAEWPAGCEVTDATLVRAQVMGLDLKWAAHALLSGPAWEAYDAAVRPAWEAYDAAVRPAREAYDAAVRSAILGALQIA
jgi:hypothetical protein